MYRACIHKATVKIQDIQGLKFGSLELANVSFSDCYIRVILSKDHRKKGRKKRSKTKTRDEKIRDV
jgi:hypothetical protein